MRAGWAWARSELRRRRRSDVLLALLIGLTGAVVLTAAAGARRTDTAFERFLSWSRAADVQVQSDTEAGIDDEVRTAFLEHPDVEIAVPLYFTFGFNDDSEFDLTVVSGPDPALLRDIDRPRVLEGRRPDPQAADEVLLSPFLQEDLGAEVGDRIELQTFSADTDFEDQSTPPQPGPVADVEVVGIATLPYDAADSSFGFVLGTPAFFERYARNAAGFGPSLDIRVRDGVDATAVVDEVLDPYSREELFVSPSGDLEATVDDATQALVIGLWAFTGVAALAVIVSGAQAIRRRLSTADADQPALRAVGLGRSQRTLAAAMSVAPAILVGALVAAVLSIPVSATMPIGAPGRAEPEPGMRLDPVVLIGGTALLVGVLLASAVWAGVRQTSVRLADVEPRSGRAARTTPVQLLRGALPPPESVGVTMALDPGSRRGRIPVWSAFVGAALGAAGVVAVLTFGAALDVLVEDPARSGWNWTLRIDPPADADLEEVASLPDVESVGRLFQRYVVVEGEQVPGNAVSSVKGVPSFTVVSGRAPVADEEVAVGPELAESLAVGIGDRVEMVGPDGDPVSKVVVGEAVFPTFDEDVAFNTGVALTVPALEVLAHSDGDATAIVTFADGISDAEAAEQVRSVSPDAVSVYSYPVLPTDVANLDDVRPLPRALAIFLGFLALAAIGHAIATTVLRRRRELGTVRSLGFIAGDVRRIVTAQSATMAAIGLIVGVPLGVVIGRTVWRAVAEGLGVVSTPVVPVGLLAVMVPVSITAAVAVAWYPARLAGRGVALDALRAE
jgi:ABC-type lipoprotein release transport system permease subunit